jgi:glycosyltransferase involved in cell wall biosynthesis
VDAVGRTPTVFFLYRDSPMRREALRRGRGAGERYSLYGLDEIAKAGFRVDHNLAARHAPGLSARALARVLDRATHALSGYSGDYASVLACRRPLRAADVVFSTVDTVGIPLALLARAGFVRRPIVYAAIGLPERLQRLRTGAARRLFESAYRRLHTIVAYGWGEVDDLRAWLGEQGPRVEFVPFGVDAEYFRPEPWRPLKFDVVSVGADPQRDFALLVELARRLPDRTFRLVASAEHARALGERPSNVSVEVDVPLSVVRDRLASARVIALPVRENTYSGATTALLQAMASAKPVVVTRTAAIARGYHLQDGRNCRLVPSNDVTALERAVSELLEDGGAAGALAGRARETVERHLTWSHYTDRIRQLLVTACSPTTVPA